MVHPYDDRFFYCQLNFSGIALIDMVRVVSHIIQNSGKIVMKSNLMTEEFTVFLKTMISCGNIVPTCLTLIKYLLPQIHIISSSLILS